MAFGTSLINAESEQSLPRLLGVAEIIASRHLALVVGLAVLPPSGMPPGSYSDEASQRVYDRLFRKARIALAAGQSVVVDAVFAKPDVRETIASIASDLRVPCTGLWLTAPRDVLLKRVAARTGDASDATPSVVERQLTREIGPMAWFTVDTSGSCAAIERAVCETLGVSAVQVTAP